MGLIPDSQTDDMRVYLTELGRKKLLEQGFIPSYFSLSDDDAKYGVSSYVEQQATDITGDYDDNVNSISKNITIKTQIIRE